MIGRISQRLRAPKKGDDGWATQPEADIATLGLLERVSHEWQRRDQTTVDARVNLVGLLDSLGARRLHRDDETAKTATERRVDRLPDDRLDVDGRSQPLDDAFFARTAYTVDELTGFSDAVFVEVAYRCLLKRIADTAGYGGFVRALAFGTHDRIDILRGISDSFEGKHQGVVIDGLRRAALWRRAERAPLVGGIVGWVHALGSVRGSARRLQTLAARVDDARHEQAVLVAKVATLDEARAQLETALLGLSNRFRRLEAEARVRAATAGEPIDESIAMRNLMDQSKRT